MINSSPIPDNENDRIQTLHDYDVLDTIPEKEYDELTKLASYIAKMPIALISLVDKDRQWFKSKVGLEVDETPRNISFCQHAIMGDEMFDVPNALDNPLLKDNPLVTGGPEFKRYHGFPLKAPNGTNIGTLCVLDMKPGDLDSEQKSALQTIANQVITNLEIRKQNEILKKTNLQKNSFFNLSIDLICIASPEGFFERINPAFCETLEYSESELLSQPFVNFISPKDHQRTFEVISKLSQGEKTIDFVAEFITKSGQSRMLSWRASADQNTGKLYAVARDITEQLEKDRIFNLELRAIDSSVLRVELSPSKKIINANRNFCELVEFSEQEIVNNNHAKLLFDGDLSDDELWSNLLQNKTQNGVYRRRTKSGREIWIQGSYIPVINAKGEVLRIIKIAYDVTDRMVQSEKIKKLAGTQEAILNGNDYSIISTDLEGIITVFSAGAEKLLGYSASEIIDQTSLAIFHDINEVVARAGDLSKEFKIEIQPGFEVFVYKAREKGQTDENEWTYITKNGERVAVSLSITALKDVDGVLFGYLGIAKDISKEKEFVRKIQNQNEQLDQFAYVVSHDLKAPLRAINTLSQFIEEDLDGKMDEVVQGHFDLLRQRTNRMQNLINDILEYSKIGKSSVNLSVFCTKELVNDIIASLNYPYSFTFEIDDKLPKVKAQTVFFQLIFSNLISNAIKYNDKENGVLKIYTKENNSVISFVFEDNGPGIEAQYHSKVFEIFQSLNKKEDVDSTGIGLSTVKKIVEEMDGEIRIESDGKSWSKFIVELPNNIVMS